VASSQCESLLAALLALELHLARDPRGAALSGFVRRLRDSLDCLAYLFRWPDRFTAEASFVVEPTGRLYPRFTDLWLAEEDQLRAAERHASLPSINKIVSSAMAEIYAGHDPLICQRSLIQRRYYERVANTRLVKGFEIAAPEFFDHSAGHHSCLIHWSGLMDGDACVAALWAHLVLDHPVRADVPFDLSPESKRLLKVRIPCPIDQISCEDMSFPDAKNVSIRRLVIGPHHALGSKSPPGIVAAFEEDPGRFLLEASLETLIFDPTLDSAVFGARVDDPQPCPVASGMSSERMAIVPKDLVPRIRELLGEESSRTVIEVPGMDISGECEGATAS